MKKHFLTQLKQLLKWNKCNQLQHVEQEKQILQKNYVKKEKKISELHRIDCSMNQGGWQLETVWMSNVGSVPATSTGLFKCAPLQISSPSSMHVANTKDIFQQDKTKKSTFQMWCRLWKNTFWFQARIS